MPYYVPMPPDVWRSRHTYFQQAIAHHRNPALPKADIALLGGGEHGPFTKIYIAPDPQSGAPAVHFEVQNADRKARWMPPEVFLVVEFLLAFGGGLSPNDTGTGLGYVKLFSDRDGISLLRLITDAGDGEMAKQHKPNGDRTDYHNLSPAWLSKTTADEVAKEGKPSRSPHRGRREVVATALRYFRNNPRGPRPAITEAEYLAILQDAFALLDAKHRYRPSPTA